MNCAIRRIRRNFSNINPTPGIPVRRTTRFHCDSRAYLMFAIMALYPG